jgi:hypothetical protein
MSRSTEDNENNASMSLDEIEKKKKESIFKGIQDEIDRTKKTMNANKDRTIQRGPRLEQRELNDPPRNTKSDTIGAKLSLFQKAWSGVKITGLALIGLPAALVWGASALLLKSAIDMAFNVVVGSIKALAKIFETVGFAVYGVVLKSLKNDQASNVFSHSRNAMEATFSGITMALSLGLLDYKDGKLQYSTTSPLVKELGLIKTSVEKNILGYNPSDPVKQADYKGDFKFLAKIYSMIKNEAEKIGLIKKPEENNNFSYW